jgi:hypothetical protein
MLIGMELLVAILMNDDQVPKFTEDPGCERNGDLSPGGHQGLTSKSVPQVGPGTENRHEVGRKARGGREM